MCFRHHKLAMITECWTPQSSHSDNFSLLYLVCVQVMFVQQKCQFDKLILHFLYMILSLIVTLLV